MGSPNRLFVGLACVFLLVVLQSTCVVPTHAMMGRMINVGGDEGWHFGFNYSAWAMKTAPFHVGDTLVFKYNTTIFNGVPVSHNVNLLHSRKAYERCSFGRIVKLADTTQGIPGFEYTLVNRAKPLYFACSIGEGVHCTAGLMKFYVVPH